VNRFTSVFSQLLQLFSRVDLQRAAKEQKAEPTPGVSHAGASSSPCSSASCQNGRCLLRLLAAFSPSLALYGLSAL